MRALCLLLLLVLVALLASGCFENEATPTPVVELTPLATPLPSATPNADASPSYETVQQLLHGENASSDLTGRRLENWRGWVVFKHPEGSESPGEYFVDLSVSDPFAEEFLPNLPWNRDNIDPAAAPTFDAIDRKLDEIEASKLIVKLVGLSFEEMQAMPYGAEVRFSGHIMEAHNPNYLSMRNVELTVMPNLPSEPVTDPDNVIIKLSRGQCYGSCPAYSLTIYGNGFVEYEGRAYVATCGKRTATIAKEDILGLIAVIERARYFALRSRYVEEHSPDAPYYDTSVSIDGRTKEVEHYTGDLTSPTQLTIVEGRIDDAANSVQWVGDRLDYQDPCRERSMR
jgi:hypothetical protein